LQYGDTRDQAIEHIKKSNTARKTYYSLVANKVLGEKKSYNLYIKCKWHQRKYRKTNRGFYTFKRI